ncbi:MAG: hypothetical protein LC772_09810 [Chloroflexi bacterium]|nr:hypothetical protein [Chloroflexota bacterium]
MNGQVSQEAVIVNSTFRQELIAENPERPYFRRFHSERPTLIKGPRYPRRDDNAAHPWLMALTWICCGLGFSFYYAAIPGFSMHPCPPAFLESLFKANVFSVIGLLLSVWLCTRPALWDRIGGILSVLCGIGIWLAMNSA